MTEAQKKGYHYTHRKNLASIEKYGLVGKEKLVEEIRKIYLKRSSENFIRQWQVDAEVAVILRQEDKNMWAEYYDNYDKLPPELKQPVIFGLLSAAAWRGNQEFPLAWHQVLNYIDRPYLWSQGDPVLISFDINPSDQAFVMDRATRKQTESPLTEYATFFNSRVPALEYQGGHLLPELMVWNRIEPDRLVVEELPPDVKDDLRLVRAVRKTDAVFEQLLVGFEGDPMVLRKGLVELLSQKT